MAVESYDRGGKSSPRERLSERLGAEPAQPRPPPNSAVKSVRIAPDTKVVERTGAGTKEGLSIGVLSLTKQRGSERYAAEVQWKTLGSHGSYRLLMKAEEPGAAAAAASGGMAVGAAVDIKRVDIVRMTCEGAGLQFSEQRQDAAGTRATVVQLLEGNGRARVALQSGEIVAFPLKALELVPFQPAKWKKASKDPVSIDRRKKLAQQTVLRLKPGMSYTFKAQAQTIDGTWEDLSHESEPCVPAGDLEMSGYEQTLAADPAQLERERRMSELGGIKHATPPTAAKSKFDRGVAEEESPERLRASLSKRSPDQAPVSEVIAARQKAALGYEEEQQSNEKVRTEEEAAARASKVRAASEQRKDAKERAEREIMAKQAAEALMAGQRQAEEAAKKERWAENAKKEREEKAAEGKLTRNLSLLVIHGPVLKVACACS